MGLDVTHDAFSGGYSAFNRLRQCVVAAMGEESSYPPHYTFGPKGEPLEPKRELDANMVYIGDGYSQETHPGLYEFLTHSDCDGDISPEMCVKVADDLEALLPKIKALDWESHGHIKGQGGFVAAVQRFIAGCRDAASSGERLMFL